LPRDLISLKFAFCFGITTLKGVPPKLEYLKVSSCQQLQSLQFLPKDLLFLNISFNSYNHFNPQDLPTSLQYLVVIQTSGVVDSEETMGNIRKRLINLKKLITKIAEPLPNIKKWTSSKLYFE
jgi:hypothetical protein